MGITLFKTLIVWHGTPKDGSLGELIDFSGYEFQVRRRKLDQIIGLPGPRLDKYTDFFVKIKPGMLFSHRAALSRTAVLTGLRESIPVPAEIMKWLDRIKGGLAGPV